VKEFESGKEGDHPGARVGGVFGELGGSSVPSPLKGDINFKEVAGGFEIRYSDRIATEHQELVDQSADWLEDQVGVLNLGLADHRTLVADGPLTDQVKDALRTWWSVRLGDLDVA
jgi:hypothetical protein